MSTWVQLPKDDTSEKWDAMGTRAMKKFCCLVSYNLLFLIELGVIVRHRSLRSHWVDVAHATFHIVPEHINVRQSTCRAFSVKAQQKYFHSSFLRKHSNWKICELLWSSIEVQFYFYHTPRVLHFDATCRRSNSPKFFQPPRRSRVTSSKLWMRWK